MKRKTIILVLCLVIALATGGIAGGIIENIRVASQAELFVRGKKVDTHLLSAMVNGQEVFYVPIEDIVKIYGNQVKITNDTIVVSSGKVGFDDELPDGSSFKEHLLGRGVDVVDLRDKGAFKTAHMLFDVVDLELDVWTVMIADDYKGWSEGGDSLFEDLWNKAFVN